MGNPHWQPGVSGNPSGRRKKSIRTTKGMIEAFVRRNITPQKLQGLFDKLTAKDKLQFLTDILPYCASKMPTMVDLSMERLSDEQLNELYEKTIANLTRGFVMPVSEIKETILIPERSNGKEFFDVNK